MESIVFLQDKWSHAPFVALYLYFGGLAGGLFVVAVLADFLGVRSERAAVTAKLAAYGVIPVLAFAGFFLTIHLGKPERGLAFTVFFTNYNSWMTRGGWILGSAAPLMVFYAALWYFGLSPKLRRIIGAIGLIPAMALAFYTGLLLSGAWYVPLWSRAHLPSLFLTSGINTGLALAGLLVVLAWPWLGPRDLDPRPALRWLGAVLLVLLVLEGWELKGFLEDLRSQGLLMGHAKAPTTDRFQYKVESGGQLEPGTYVAVVTWAGNAAGAEEGMSADTPIRITEPKGQITIVAPRRLGVNYNVYLGPSHGEARQVAANLAPKESVVIGDLPPGGPGLPLNIQTGGQFLSSSGGRLAYRYLTGGPSYPWALLDGTAEAALPPAAGIPSIPVVFHGVPHSRSLANWFWWGVVGLALLLPIVLTVVEFLGELGSARLAHGIAAVKFASVLIGGLILRFVIVWGGDLKAPLSFPSPNWPIPPVPGG